MSITLSDTLLPSSYHSFSRLIMNSRLDNREVNNSIVKGRRGLTVQLLRFSRSAQEAERLNKNDLHFKEVEVVATLNQMRGKGFPAPFSGAETRPAAGVR